MWKKTTTVNTPTWNETNTQSLSQRLLNYYSTLSKLIFKVCCCLLHFELPKNFHKGSTKNPLPNLFLGHSELQNSQISKSLIIVTLSFVIWKEYTFFFQRTIVAAKITFWFLFILLKISYFINKKNNKTNKNVWHILIWCHYIILIYLQRAQIKEDKR